MKNQHIKALSECIKMNQYTKIEPCAFWSLVSPLEEVKPRKMKLAFWINVHNALAMHEWFMEFQPTVSKKCLRYLRHVTEQGLLRNKYHPLLKNYDASFVGMFSRQLYAMVLYDDITIWSLIVSPLSLQSRRLSPSFITGFIASLVSSR